MQGLHEIKVRLKTHEPEEKELMLTVKEGTTINELIKKSGIKSLDDYAVLVNGLSVTDLNARVINGSVIVILPKVLGG